MMAFAADNKPAQNGAQTQSGQSEQATAQMQNPKAKLSRELSRMLNSTNNARTAIKQNNQQQATKDVQQALNSANAATAEHSGPDLAPLYTELDRVSVIEPVMRAQKSGSNQTANSSNQSNTNQAANNSNQTGSADRTAPNSQNSRGLAVHEVVGGYTAAFLDVSAAQKHLQAAQQELGKNDMKAADRDLRAVQDSVVVESVSSDMPLLRARENLVLARDSAQAGKYQRAESQLHAASRALASYEKTSTSHSQDAAHLRSEIDNYAQSMTNNHSGASTKIENWWSDTTNWIAPGNTASTKTPNASASNH